MSFRIGLLTLWVLAVPLIARLLPAHQTAIVTAHEFVSSLAVAVLLYKRDVLSRAEKNFAFSFIALAFADLLYGFTGELLLDKSNLTSIVVIRELAYMTFSVAFALALGSTYRKSLSKPVMVLTVGTLAAVLTFAGFSNVLSPLSQIPDYSALFIASGAIYCVCRSLVLSLALQQMVFEKSLKRFLFLFSIVQMFLSEVSFTFQSNVVAAPQTPLNSWLETGWQMSTALFFAIALSSKRDEPAFGQSSTAHWKSVRVMTVLLVALVMVIQAAWLVAFGFMQVANLVAFTQLISLGFLGWVIANSFGILVSSQIERVFGKRDGAEDQSYFMLEEIRKALEHVVSINRKMDEKKWMAKMGELSTQITHDIRSPLSVLNLVISTLDNIESERLDMIKAATKRINGIANQLLKQGQTEKAGASLAKPALLATVLTATVREKRVEFQDAKRITFEETFDGYQGLTSNIDTQAFTQVLSNVINNAVEAIEGHGRIIISLTSSSGSNQISISDTGKGIRQEVLSRIGELGFSFGKSNSNSGSGLGFHHAKQSIESMGGSISISSEVGQGTTVTITLPRAEVPARGISLRAQRETETELNA